MLPRDLPELAIVRVLTTGGPYAVDDTISVAFTTPTIGRLLAHTSTVLDDRTTIDTSGFVPDTISVRVTHPAPPYGVDELLTLSFVDPRVARIHPTGGGAREILARANASERERSVVVAASEMASEANVIHTASRASSGDSIAIAWDAESGDARSTTVSIADEARASCGDTDARGETNAPKDERQSTTDFARNSSRDATPGPSQISPYETIVSATSNTGTGTEILAAEALAPTFRDSRNDECLHESSALEPSTKNASLSTGALAIERMAPTIENGRDDRGISRELATDVSLAHETRELPSRSELVDSSKHPEVRTKATGVCVRLRWNSDRVRRFVQVVDKLFTVDRLGWYRHFFAMRLLVPDEISCGDAIADVEAMRHLVALRAAAVETLGRPLLAAFMPNFVVTQEWLDSLDSPAAARAIAGLRDAIVPFVDDDATKPLAGDLATTTGIVARHELSSQPASTVESLLPIFIGTQANDPMLSDRLSAYRKALVEVFGQTAQSAEAVRLTTMSQANHALDDRLWQLVGVVGESLGGLAVA